MSWFHVNWANYNDLSRGHPKWWFSKGIPPQMPLIQVFLGIIVISQMLISTVYTPKV